MAFVFLPRTGLSEDAIRLSKQCSWIFPRDPDFEAKGALALDLYSRTWAKTPREKGLRDLGPREDLDIGS